MRRGRFVALLAAILFCIGIAALAVGNKLPFFVLYATIGLSAIAFIAYARDKSAARTGNWRTPEITLHLLALFGGWPGALAAQVTLRHKSSKRSFLTVFWFTVLLNCSLIAVLLDY